MADIKFFVNDNFNALAHMYDIMNKDHVVSITQYELGEVLFTCRATANRIVRDLREAGYIIQDPGRLGRYTLTDEAIKIVENFRRSQNYINK